MSQDPDLLLRARRELAALIVTMKKLVSRAEYEKIRDARHAARLRREREMLRKRAATTQPAEEKD